MLTAAFASPLTRAILPTAILTVVVGSCCAVWALWTNIGHGVVPATVALAVQLVLCGALAVMSVAVVERICDVVQGGAGRVLLALAACLVMWTIVPMAAHHTLGTPDVFLTAAPAALLGLLLPVFLAIGLARITEV